LPSSIAEAFAVRSPGAVSVIFAKLPFAAEQSLHLANTDQEFLVINGWVLTNEDFAETEMTNHVARL
jgi:hypothetical protein